MSLKEDMDEINDQSIDVKINPSDKVLASDTSQDRNLVIWCQEDLVFISIGQTTIGMPESDFYSLTKLTQEAAKKLLRIE